MITPKDRDAIMEYIDKYTVELGITNYPYVSACDLKDFLNSLVGEDVEDSGELLRCRFWEADCGSGDLCYWHIHCNYEDHAECLDFSPSVTK